MSHIEKEQGTYRAWFADPLGRVQSGLAPPAINRHDRMLRWIARNPYLHAVR